MSYSEYGVQLSLLQYQIQYLGTQVPPIVGRSMSPSSATSPKLVLVVAAALISRASHPDGVARVLLTQRPAAKNFGGLWEFPGGKLEQGESAEQAHARARATLTRSHSVYARTQSQHTHTSTHARVRARARHRAGAGARAARGGGRAHRHGGHPAAHVRVARVHARARRQTPHTPPPTHRTRVDLRARCTG